MGFALAHRSPGGVDRCKHFRCLFNFGQFQFLQPLPYLLALGTTEEILERYGAQSLEEAFFSATGAAIDEEREDEEVEA